jgi:hypothetical protein
VGLEIEWVRPRGTFQGSCDKKSVHEVVYHLKEVLELPVDAHVPRYRPGTEGNRIGFEGDFREKRRLAQ